MSDAVRSMGRINRRDLFAECARGGVVPKSTSRRRIRHKARNLGGGQ